MKRGIAAVLALLLCGLASAAGDATPVAAPVPRHITILHPNDLHGHLTPWVGWEGDLAGRTVGGLDRLAARIQEVRVAVGPARVLLLDAGDTIGDTLIAAETEGRAIIETMNALR